MAYATIKALYRYPLKGFSAEPLAGAEVAPSEPLPFDRIFAIENGPSGFDSAAPSYLPKIRFLMLMRNERIARLESRFDPESATLTILKDGRQCVSGALVDPVGRTRVENWIAAEFLDELRGPPRILHASGHSFSDTPKKVLHLINLASVRSLEKKLGRAIDPMRFRANIVIDGAEPFSELDWLNRQLCAGEAIMTIADRTKRCAATNVEPGTGNRDLQLPMRLMDLYGHSDFGIYLSVDRGGAISVGDTITIAERAHAGLPFSDP